MKNHWLERKETKNLSLFEVDDGEQHWYSAETYSEAQQMHSEPLRNPKTGKVDFVFHGIECIKTSMVSPNKVISVRMIDEDNEVVRKTAAEWAAEGKGFVASTVY